MKAALIIVDGAGVADHSSAGNAVTPQTLPFWHQMMELYGSATLEASGSAIGLDDGQAGNSEIGHLTIGAGRCIPTMQRRIEEAYKSGEFQKNPLWSCLAKKRKLHVLGLLSAAGTHGDWRNLARCAVLAVQAGVEEVIVHPVLDGVDSPAGSARDLLAELRQSLQSVSGVSLGLVMGRASFCDRSGNMSVTETFRNALTGEGQLQQFDDAALQNHLLQNTSEATFPGHFYSANFAVKAEDAVLLTQHRADRARQIAASLGEVCQVYSLIELEGAIEQDHVFFASSPLDRGLGFELLHHGLSSVRVAEKCKFPHVTTFFNGLNAGLEGREVCIPSVPEADLAKTPQMSVDAVADAVVDAITDPKVDLVIANLANLDQIGHLGNYALAAEAARHVDRALHKIVEACQREGTCAVITSDHGNADCVTDAQGRPFGSHTTNPVPVVLVPPLGHSVHWQGSHGTIAQLAPTLMGILGLEAPGYMAPSLAKVSVTQFIEGRAA
jgi:2,3-bisphosphoglycerate-independent phosphoglycerate mutase